MNDRIDLLVIEDNPADAELMRRAIERLETPLNIQFTNDGVRALEALHGPLAIKEETPPRLIILDLKLPKMDGHEVLRRIRAHKRTQAIPVVVLTSSQQESDIRTSYEAGANSYMVKPVDFSQFAKSVEVLSTYWLTINQPPL